MIWFANNGVSISMAELERMSRRELERLENCIMAPQLRNAQVSPPPYGQRMEQKEAKETKKSEACGAGFGGTIWADEFSTISELRDTNHDGAAR